MVSATSKRTKVPGRGNFMCSQGLTEQVRHELDIEDGLKVSHSEKTVQVES